MLPADRPDREVGWPRAVQTGVAILGACAFGAVALSYGYGFGGGGRTESYPQGAAASFSAPNTPTVDAWVHNTTADSLRVVGSLFSADPGDTHDSVAIQIDTAGGDFSSPKYFNDTLAAADLDTLAVSDSAAVVVTRIAYKAANGGWSAWSDSVSTSMVQWWRLNEPAGFTTRVDNEFSCETGEDWSDDFTEEGTGSPTRDLGAFFCMSDRTAPRASQHGVDSVTANLFMNADNPDFNVGVLGGGSPNKLNGSNVDWAADSLYVTYWLKFSSDFDDRSTAKLVWAQNNYSASLYSTNTGLNRVTTTAGDSEPWQVFCQNSCTWTGAETGPTLVQDSLSNPSGGTRLVNAAYVTPGTSIQIFTRGEWEYHEVLWVVNSTTSAEDGEIHMWVDGTKVIEYTGILWLGTNSVGESGPKWDRVMIEIITRNYDVNNELTGAEHEAFFNGFYVSTN